MENPGYLNGPPTTARYKRLRSVDYPRHPVNQVHGLTCVYTETGRPECILETTVPLIHEFGIYASDQEIKPLARIRLQGIKFSLRTFGEAIDAKWVMTQGHGTTPVVQTQNYGQAIKLRIPSTGPEIANEPNWQSVKRGPFLAVAEGNRELSIEITTDPLPVEEKAVQNCFRARKEQGQTLASHCIDLIGKNLVYRTSRCRRAVDTNAWICPWSMPAYFGAIHVLEGDTESHSTVYELNSNVNRDFLALLLNISGIAEAPLSSASAMSELRDQVVLDYRVIMGMDPRYKDDSDAITSSLTRQPQLFPYYVDRDFWAKQIMADLERKLGRMGFPQ